VEASKESPISNGDGERERESLRLWSTEPVTMVNWIELVNMKRN